MSKNTGSKYLHKLVILGDSAVGKSSILQRYIKGKFSDSYKVTIGADFLPKTITVDDRAVYLQIWDTAGQERFQSLGTSFYRGADGCVLVFDVTKRKTFDSLKKWKAQFIEQKHAPPDFPYLVLGNKIDLPGDHVNDKKVKKWCDEEHMLYYPVMLPHRMIFISAWHCVYFSHCCGVFVPSFTSSCFFLLFRDD